MTTKDPPRRTSSADRLKGTTAGIDRYLRALGTGTMPDTVCLKTLIDRIEITRHREAQP